MSMNPLILDTETSGLGTTAGVCEIGWQKLDDDGEIVASDVSLIDPESPISPGAAGVHGIFDKDVADAPTLEEYMTVVHDKPFMDKDYLFIAHNAPFDWRFVGDWVTSTKTLCTLRLARKLYPECENHKLQTLRAYLELPFVKGDAHSAMGDVEVVRQFLHRVNQDFGHDLADMVQIAMSPFEITKMAFGKHKGDKLVDLPAQYVRWLLKQNDVDPDLRTALEKL